MGIKFGILSVLLLVFLLAGFIYVARSLDTPKRNEPVARVAGQAIYEDELLSLIQGPLRQLRNQEYEVKNQALENLVDRKVLEAAAKKKGLSPEKLMEQEVDAKVAEPTEAELKALYSNQKDQPKRPFDQIKTQLQEALKQARIRQARQEYLKHLREQTEVAIYLRPPKVTVAYDSNRLRGNPKAPVVIVEFSDFQCPYCRKVQPTLKDLLAKYDGRVSLAYRDFPLREIHPQAQLAAEASRCAAEQGKFWEYHDLLFANPDKLDRQGLLEQARSLKLDEKQFDSCLASGKYKGKIEKDIREGSQAGVSGTPGFFINGIPLSGAQPEATFERFIKVELSGPTNRSAAQ